MDLVANEAGRLVDQVGAVTEALLEIDLVTGGDGDTIGDDDHRAFLCSLTGGLPD